DLPRRQAPLLEHDGQDLIRQVPHALSEIDHGEQDGEALRVPTLEREEPAQPGEHCRTIRHWVNLLRQIHSALAARPSRSARTATLRAPWQPSTGLAHARRVIHIRSPRL